MIGKEQFVIANAENIALDDLLSRDALAMMLNPVGGAHIDKEVNTTLVFDHRVLARHVGISQRKVA